MNKQFKSFAKSTAIKTGIMFKQHKTEIIAGASALAVGILLKKQYNNELEQLNIKHNEEKSRLVDDAWDDGYAAGGVTHMSLALHNIVNAGLVTKEDAQEYYDWNIEDIGLGVGEGRTAKMQARLHENIGELGGVEFTY